MRAVLFASAKAQARLQVARDYGPSGALYTPRQCPGAWKRWLIRGQEHTGKTSPYNDVGSAQPHSEKRNNE
jgi:hypothetical protein